MNRDAIDRIRRATFPQARRGYERREVDEFLDELADWLETGGSDEARANFVRRELERIGEQTTAILTEAHDAAETMRIDADRQVRKLLADANIKADEMRTRADEYAEEVREEVDVYAGRTRASAEAEAEEARQEAESTLTNARARADEQTSEVRAEADEYAARVRAEADEYTSKLRSDAEETAARLKVEAEWALAEAKAAGERTAKQIVEEANRRKGEIETVISDLEHRRATVIDELRKLAENVAGAAGQAGPPSGPAPREGAPQTWPAKAVAGAERSQPASPGTDDAER